MDCERHDHYRCPSYSLEPNDWCRACLLAECERLLPIEQAAETLILAKRGWERWGSGHFLYDRTGGFAEGRVFPTADALERFAEETRRARARAKARRST